jgi:hypothetical protein
LPYTTIFVCFSDLKCQVEMLGAGDDSSSDDESSSSSSAAAFVDWVFMSGESDAVMEILAAKGVATLPNGRWTSLVKRSYNFVDESDIEEHYLDLEAATGHDEGVYICRVSLSKEKQTGKFDKRRKCFFIFFGRNYGNWF